MKRSNIHSGIGLFLLAFAVYAGGFAADADAAERKLTFAVKGVVAEVLVKPGDSVKKGDALARLDPVAIKTHLGVMEARVRAAELGAMIAEKELQRQQELFDAISTTGAKVEEAELAQAEAEAKLSQAEGRLKMAKIRLGMATLTAPFAGTVKAVPGFAGQVVNPDASLETVVVIDDGQ